MELLLVEDEGTTSHALTALLRRLGVKVRHAPEVIQALEELTRLPEVVVLDFSLSDDTALEILKMIRDTGFVCRIAVLMPAQDHKRNLAQIQAFKPTAIFQKPLDFEDFGHWLCDLFP